MLSLDTSALRIKPLIRNKRLSVGGGSTTCWQRRCVSFLFNLTPSKKLRDVYLILFFPFDFCRGLIRVAVLNKLG